MRCDFCGLFVSHESKGTLTALGCDRQGMLTAAVLLTNSCSECGEVLQEKELQIVGKAGHCADGIYAVTDGGVKVTHHKDRTGRVTYQCEIQCRIGCECGWHSKVKMERSIPASEMITVGMY